MGKTIEATFDGSVFRPTEPVPIEPNTRVWLTVEPALPVAAEPTSFLQTARDLKLDGPPDWSANIDRYLYGEDPRHGA